MNDNVFINELILLLNRYSKENGSNTPDFILADYLYSCLCVWDKHVMERSKWYSGVDKIKIPTISTGSKPEGENK